MKFQHLALTLATSSFFAGCASQTPAPTSADLSRDLICYFPGSQEEAPEWICTGNVEGLITGLGEYPNAEDNYNLAFQVAQQRARVDLSRKLNIRIMAEISDSQQATGTGATLFQEQFNKDVSSSFIHTQLKGSKVYASTVGPTGKLYTLVGIDATLANSKLAKHVQSSYSNHEAQHIKSEGEQNIQALKDTSRASK